MFTPTHAKAIVDLMHKAKLHIDYPKVRLQSKDLTIQLSVAGLNAKMPNSINITDGESYPYNKFFGYILVDGTLKWSYATSINMQTKINNVFEQFVDNPAQYAKIYSNTTGNCMFCGKTLTDPQSVVVGYGPICAAHYDLPHGEIDKQTANDLTQIEMSLDKLVKLQISETIQHSITDNGKQELPFYDITAPKLGVQIEIREDQSVIWISIDGQTILRICKIPKLKIQNRGK